MAEIEKSEEQEILDGGDTQNHQSPGSENSEKMLKPWMKNLGKEFYMDEELAKYDSLPDAVRALKARPKAKDVPDTYGESEEIEKAYKAAGLTKKEAEAISAAYKPMIPEKPMDLKEAFGDAYDSTMANYSKGIGSFADDLKDRIGKAGLDKIPEFVRIMARVGKETGGDNFNKTPSKGDGKDPARRYVEKVYGIK